MIFSEICRFLLIVWNNPSQKQTHKQKSMTCVLFATHLHLFWLSSNLYASQYVFNIWPPNASQHKLITRQLYMHEIYGLLQLA